MRTLFVCLVTLGAVVNAPAEDLNWRICWNDNGREVTGDAFTATKPEAEAKLAWARSLEPNVERRLVAIHGLIPRPEIAVLAEDRGQRRLYAISVTAALAGHALDIFSSYNKTELNPMLQSRNGRFGMQSVAIKSGVVGGLEVFQLWRVHKDPRFRKTAIWTNFVVAGVMSGLAAHNFQIH
jgi:hypothetical protein